MIALIIIAAVFAVIVLLLLLPVSAEISYQDNFSAVIKYGGIRVYKSNDDKKPQQKAKEEKAQKKGEKSKSKEQGFIASVFKEKGKIAGLKFCFSLIKIAFKKTVWVLKKIKFKKFVLDVSVASDDAANTAIAYGALCAVAYPALNLMEQYASFEIKQVDIYTNFDKLSPEIKVSMQLKTRLIFAVVAAFSLLLSYNRLKKESDNNG